MSDSKANRSLHRVVAGIWLYATISITDNVRDWQFSNNRVIPLDRQ